jgi:glutaminyl-peptide cyclotransferase
VSTIDESQPGEERPRRRRHRHRHYPEVVSTVVESEPAEERPRRRHRSRRRRAERRAKLYAALGIAAFAVVVSAVLVYAGNPFAVAEKPAPVYGFTVLNKYPHDPKAFTEGLIYQDGFLYESTGLDNESSVREVELETGKVLRRHDLQGHFGEGLTDWGFKLIQLTYTSHIGFVYDLKSFKELSTFPYTGQGWGLTHDDRRLIMSDGSANLRFFDPETHKELSQIRVADAGEPITKLNELEMVRGDIYANVWETDRIAVIDPKSGHVREWIDLTGLDPIVKAQSGAVLNGIAYDPQGDRLFVTGKNWENVYQIRVTRPVVSDH